MRSEAQKKAQKKWRLENKEKVIAYRKSEKGKAKQSKSLRAYYRRRIKKDPAFKLSCNMRKRLQSFLKRKGLNKSNKTMELVGCSKDFLREHLEKQFKPGMNWSNHNFRGWHVDHIVPLSKLDCSDPDQLKRACHYSNLQPLWAEENFKKHNSLY